MRKRTAARVRAVVTVEQAVAQAAESETALFFWRK